MTGRSFNGRTAVRDAQMWGSIPLLSTPFPGVFGSAELPGISEDADAFCHIQTGPRTVAVVWCLLPSDHCHAEAAIGPSSGQPACAGRYTRGGVGQNPILFNFRGALAQGEALRGPDEESEELRVAAGKASANKETPYKRTPFPLGALPRILREFMQRTSDAQGECL